MNYISTRNKNANVSAAYAIARGISPEGGLYVPERMPEIPRQAITELAAKSYTERAKCILTPLLTDFTADEIETCVNGAYTGGKFENDQIAPIAKLSPDTYMLELWHGPTCAFKDMALQLLPYLLSTSIKKTEAGKDVAILVATSGDTGKAALEGFKDVPGTKIIVFYPGGGVSEAQRLQMVTQEGGNVSVMAVNGNFDDTQTLVKEIFTDKAMIADLEKKNTIFSSANSINWGRLAPQICYYFSAYSDLVAENEIAMGDLLDVCVPTGNFGNILAAYYAKQMGLPLGKLICASNANNVLTDFFNTGVYDRRRNFYLTTSPSMDILISSNLERLLFALYDNNDEKITELMQGLSADGMYTVSEKVKQKLDEGFYAGCCSDGETIATIKQTFEKYSYLCDTHTAVAIHTANEYKKQNPKSKVLVVSTANPYKFSNSILQAFTNDIPKDPFEQAGLLSQITNTTIPRQILSLKTKPQRFTESCDKSEMEAYVREQFGV